MRISDWSSDVCSSDLSKGEKSLVVWAARPWAAGGRHLAQPGQIIMRDQSGFAVACGGETELYVTEWDYQGGGMPALNARLGGGTERRGWNASGTAGCSTRLTTMNRWDRGGQDGKAE